MVLVIVTLQLSPFVLLVPVAMLLLLLLWLKTRDAGSGPGDALYVLAWLAICVGLLLLAYTILLTYLYLTK